jgi:DNA gyrase subunit A
MIETALTSTTEMSDVLKEYFGIYATYVIGERAIPDVRDGLKPVHRRLIYAAWSMGAREPNRPIKCAKIVGETMGNYHPHGDKAIYDSLVRMTQLFAMRIPLFEGQGNFGSIDGDPPAAMRYTESRLFKIAQEMFCNDLNSEVVNFVPNYDESTEEPEVLPSELPHLLLNYNTGIAVGLATEVLSCCAHEVIDCLIGEIDDNLITNSRDTAPKEFRGPDLPTHGILEQNKDSLDSLWKEGKSSWKIRGEAVFETDETTGNRRVVVTSLPFQQQKDKWLEETAKLVVEKDAEGNRSIEGIADMRDESSKEGIRVVFDIQTSSSPEVVLNSLYKKTKLNKNLSTGIVAIVDGKPKCIGVRETMLRWLDFRRECLRKILEKEKREKEERAEVVDGLLIVHKNVNKVIKAIREAEDSKQALIDVFDMTERQAAAVVSMRLGSLRKIDNEALAEEKKSLQERIQEITEILKDSKKVDLLIKERLTWWKDQLDGRRTKIVNEFGEISALDTIVERDVFVSINRKQEFKVTPVDSYRKIKRGGRGVKETDGEDPDDVPSLLAQVTTHDMLYAFTDKSRVFEKSCHELPITRRNGKRQPLTKLFSDLDEDERVVSIMAMNVENMPEDASVVMVRSNGNVKRMSCRGLIKKRGRMWGDECCRTDLDDSILVDVTFAEPERDIILFTQSGLFRRIALDALRMNAGRNSGASKCMTLDKDDKVIFVDTLGENDLVSTISERGFGSRVHESNLNKKKGRVGKGYRLSKVDEKSGKIVFGGVLTESHELFVTTSGGKSIRISSEDIPEVGRGSRGVRVQKLGQGEKIVAAARIHTHD